MNHSTAPMQKDQESLCLSFSGFSITKAVYTLMSLIIVTVFPTAHREKVIFRIP